MTIPSNRVAVIGAGISGVVTAAHLRIEGIDITVFERSSAAGGIWLYDERKPLEPAYPSTVASQAGRSFTIDGSENDEKLTHAPPGPCYVGLKNNVSTPLLETTLQRFPSGTPDFVSHAVLKDYIQDISRTTGVQNVTLYNTSVDNISKIGSKWNVETSTLHINRDGAVVREADASKFDAVVVASGHYHAPIVPNTPGLAEWKRRWPDRVSHSKSYRNPDGAQDKNFLLVGGSVSSTDIARELGPFAGTIYQSQRNGSFDLSANLLPDNGYRIDEVVSYDLPDISGQQTSLDASEPIPATVTLKSGKKLCHIHYVILCTGYHLTLPFLSHLHSDDTPVSEADEKVLVTNGTQFHNLHKDIFYIDDPSLVFVGVPFFTATFTLFEFQAMVVAKVLSGQSKLPNKEHMRQEYNQRVLAKGYGKLFHSLRDKEVEYVNELLSWVNRDLEAIGQEKINGHTDSWHIAKEAQVQRIKALFAAATVDKDFQIECP